jgi:hypothetical protein
MRHRWNDTGEQPKNSEKKVSKCHFVYHKSRTNRPTRWSWRPAAWVTARTRRSLSRERSVYREGRNWYFSITRISHFKVSFTWTKLPFHLLLSISMKPRLLWETTTDRGVIHFTVCSSSHSWGGTCSGKGRWLFGQVPTYRITKGTKSLPHSPQPLQTNAGILPQIKSDLPLYTAFLMQYPLSTLSFNVI